MDSARRSQPDQKSPVERDIMSERSQLQKARDQRLGAALRENLKRRRAQARTREQIPEPAPRADGEAGRKPEDDDDVRSG
jgi:hypothetical protein